MACKEQLYFTQRCMKSREVAVLNAIHYRSNLLRAEEEAVVFIYLKDCISLENPLRYNRRVQGSNFVPPGCNLAILSRT
jgi:hypothetical protein